MINTSFWRMVKEKWIRDEDPAIDAVKDLVQGSGESTQEINDLNRLLNGPMTGVDSTGSLDDINNMMEQLKELGIDEIPFEDLF